MLERSALGDRARRVKVTKAASPATVSVTDTRIQTALSVAVTITGTTFTITPTDSAVTLENASWCLKAKNAARVETGTGTSGASTIKHQNGTTKPIAFVVVYTVTSTPTGTCWDTTLSSTIDVYVGPINTLDNALDYSSTDGNCTDPIIGRETLVQADDKRTADGLCQSVLGHSALFTMQSVGYTAAPADVWLCRQQ